MPEQNLAATTAPQVSATEPTAQGDHSSKTTAVKPTPKSTKRPKLKKIQKPPKPTIKATLEDEIPEQLPVTTQKSLETTAATSSQQMVERSQPMSQTPPASSQKEQVVRTGTPNYDALESLDSIIHSPLPGANSLSTPIIISQIPPSIITLLHALDITQT